MLTTVRTKYQQAINQFKYEFGGAFAEGVIKKEPDGSTTTPLGVIPPDAPYGRRAVFPLLNGNLEVLYYINEEGAVVRETRRYWNGRTMRAIELETIN